MANKKNQISCLLAVYTTILVVVLYMPFLLVELARYRSARPYYNSVICILAELARAYNSDVLQRHLVSSYNNVAQMSFLFENDLDEN